MKRSLWFNSVRRAALVFSPLFLVVVAHAQSLFDSESNGSYGPLTVSADTTLTLPADGIFHCTTITVNEGATLRFTKNENNTPVYLLATGDVRIAGTIDVSATAPLDGTGAYFGGTGGPGGFDGGASGVLNGLAIDTPTGGHGPGGGVPSNDTSWGGAGSFGDASDVGFARKTNGSTYGNVLLMPLVGGSGGGACSAGPGGGGGGALLISSNTKIVVTGTILSNGGSFTSYASGGSGGAVRLVAPRVFGDGTIDVQTRWKGGVGYRDGGNGRIRIDSLVRVEPTDPTQLLALKFRGTASVGANLRSFAPNKPTLTLQLQDSFGNMTTVNGRQLVTIPQGGRIVASIFILKNFPPGKRVRLFLNVVAAGMQASETFLDVTPTAAVGQTEEIRTVLAPSTVNRKLDVYAWAVQL